jgi:hypothetical protein
MGQGQLAPWKVAEPEFWQACPKLREMLAVLARRNGAGASVVIVFRGQPGAAQCLTGCAISSPNRTQDMG